jgi:hypothetical protein
MSSRTKKKCENKWEQLLEQNPIIVGTILCVISNKNKYSVRTRVGSSCYYSPNKILIARTTYYSNENKFTSHRTIKILIEGKILKSNEYKNGNRKKWSRK